MGWTEGRCAVMHMHGRERVDMGGVGSYGPAYVEPSSALVGVARLVLSLRRPVD